MHSNDWATYLDPDEKLLWQGAPKPGYLVFRTIDLFLIPFVLVWMSIPTLSLFSTAPTGFLPFQLMFIAVGLYLLFGRFIVAGLKRRSTRYAVSSKRVFIATNSFGKKIVEQPIDPSLKITLKPGHLGSIVLGEEHSALGSRTGLSIWTGETGDFRLQRLSDADEVYQLIRKVQRGET